MGQSITCKAPNMVVRISKDHSRIYIIDLHDPGHPESYSVDAKDGRDSDGDTFVSYYGVEISPDPETYITLTFSDENGDTLTYRHDVDEEAPIQLDCK
ncbi:MAG: hypothetical protein ACXVAX_11780 [Pseudobdellovibrio sp.]